VNNFRPQQAPPVSEGQEVDVQIESIGDKGDGVARVKGFVVFVPSVQKGDWVRIRIKKVLANVAFADKLREVQAPPESEQLRTQRPSTPKDFADSVDLDNLEDSEDFGEEEE
jgi:predicted RNA-binding protein with TRAM domain